MRITCAWCGTRLGEKCPTCGCKIFHTFRSWWVGPWLMECLACGNTFRPGTGGVTTSICCPCLKAKREEIALRGKTKC